MGIVASTESRWSILPTAALEVEAFPLEWRVRVSGSRLTEHGLILSALAISLMVACWPVSSIFCHRNARAMALISVLSTWRAAGGMGGPPHQTGDGAEFLHDVAKPLRPEPQFESVELEVDPLDQKLYDTGLIGAKMSSAFDVLSRHPSLRGGNGEIDMHNWRQPA